MTEPLPHKPPTADTNHDPEANEAVPEGPRESIRKVRDEVKLRGNGVSKVHAVVAEISRTLGGEYERRDDQEQFEQRRRRTRKH